MWIRVPLLVAVSACSSASHAPRTLRSGAPLACELRSYTIASVDEYRERDPRSKVGMAHPRGAELFIQAQPGVTAEWLQLQLAAHIQAARHAAQSPDCPLDVDDATVSVQSEGPGFLVRIRAPTDDDAAELIRRARALIDARVL